MKPNQNTHPTTVRDQIAEIGFVPPLQEAHLQPQQICDTARKIFSCLNFPLENFTKGNQKTAIINQVDTTEQVQK